MNLYIKKMIAIVLTIALCLSSAACAAEPDGKKSKKHGEKVNEEPVLAPETELPAYSDDFLLVLEHTRLDPAPVDAFFGYALGSFCARSFVHTFAIIEERIKQCQENPKKEKPSVRSASFRLEDWARSEKI